MNVRKCRGENPNPPTPFPPIVGGKGEHERAARWISSSEFGMSLRRVMETQR
jgi:hypothetical protein